MVGSFVTRSQSSDNQINVNDIGKVSGCSDWLGSYWLGSQSDSNLIAHLKFIIDDKLN